MFKISFFPLLVLAASVMSLDALAFDTFIPALAAISDSLGVANSNNSQWIISVYLFSFGICQIIYAPLSLYLGRNNALRFGLFLAFCGFLLAALSENIYIMILSRIIQGAGCAARVLTSSLFRDVAEGPELAKLLSRSFLIYILFTIVSPVLGYLISGGERWRIGFLLLSGYTLLVFLFVSLRASEPTSTYSHETVARKTVKNVLVGIYRTRNFIRYAAAMGLITGSLFSLLISLQQIFSDVYRDKSLFVLIFVGLNLVLACASAINPMIIARWGLYGPIKCALLGHVIVTATALLASPVCGVALFAACEALLMVCFGFSYQNLSALALSSLEGEYGSGSALQGSIVLLLATSIGTAVGQFYNGSITPVLLGQCLSAALAFALIYLPADNDRKRSANAFLSEGGG